MDSDTMKEASSVQRIARPNRLTREFLERLPFLIPLAVVIEVTGLSSHGVREAVEAGSLRVWRLGTSRKGKYYREEVLRLIGFEANAQIRSHSPDAHGSRSAGSTATGHR